jgi:glutamate carboxypeptidase
MTPEATGSTEIGERTLERVHGMHEAFVDFVSRLCRVESPTDHPDTQSEVHAILEPAFRELDYDVRIIRGLKSGNHLLAVPRVRSRRSPFQLLMGHSDTVWPIGTLDRMPVCVEGDRLRGPGTLDMKGGLGMIVFALRVLRDMDMVPTVAPVVFVNADEETGSPDSKRHVVRLAKASNRALVLEPALGPSGLIKTARKGVGNFEVVVRGKAAHAGLDPEAGASAILEISHVIQELDLLNEPSKGTTLNVGLVKGGTRPNVVAAEAIASVDVRVTSSDYGRRIEERMSAIEPVNQDVAIEVHGAIRVPPLERTPRNVTLWKEARQRGVDLGLVLDHGLAGGGSDGNTTSLYTATLDGLGCVGDGAHADHEHIELTASLDRCALLARLLMSPALAES